MLDVIEVSQRVARGAQFLDGLFGPEWVDRVNLDTLEMSTPCNCVAGQLHDGSYWAAMADWLSISPTASDEENEPAVERGFDLTGDEAYLSGWDLLQSAWVGLITVRRSRAKAGE